MHFVAPILLDLTPSVWYYKDSERIVFRGHISALLGGLPIPLFC